jgi:CBS domain-containing protein
VAGVGRDGAAASATDANVGFRPIGTALDLSRNGARASGTLRLALIFQSTPAHLTGDSMRARDIMTSNPLVVTASDPVSRAAEIMRDAEIGIVPIVDDRERRHLIGVITDRDIAVRCVAQRHVPACEVRLHMSGEHLHTVAPDDDVSRVIASMAHDQVRRIPVVADDGRLIGMISQADLATKVGPDHPLDVERVLESVSARVTHSQADGSHAPFVRE